MNTSHASAPLLHPLTRPLTASVFLVLHLYGERRAWRWVVLLLLLLLLLLGLLWVQLLLLLVLLLLLLLVLAG